VLVAVNETVEAQLLLREATNIRDRNPRDIDAAGVATFEQYAVVLRKNGHGSDADVAEARARSMRAELKYVVRALK
jgi:hypothetical protein